MDETSKNLKNKYMSKYKPITITPKEKAQQLIESVDFSIFQFMREDDDDSETAYWANHPKSNFWVEVEKELKNM